MTCRHGESGPCISCEQLARRISKQKPTPQPTIRSVKDLMGYRMWFLERRWPLNGIPPIEVDAEEFDRVVDALQYHRRPDPKMDLRGSLRAEWESETEATKRKGVLRLCGVDVRRYDRSVASVGVPQLEAKKG